MHHVELSASPASRSYVGGAGGVRGGVDVGGGVGYSQGVDNTMVV